MATLHLAVAARTDVGKVRSENEDSFFAEADAQRGVFMVADGMGGHAAGEVASEMAVQIVTHALVHLRTALDPDAAERTAQSLRDANRAIYDRTLVEGDKQGMGTTASVLIVSDGHYLIGHVGDSRIYLLRDGSLTQLTTDHSYVQEQVAAGLLTPEQARYHPYSNVITRCVGASHHVEPDLFEGDAHLGDVFLIASDGLTGMIDDVRLQELLLAPRKPARIVDSLIAEANSRGGFDNITAIVVQILAD